MTSISHGASPLAKARFPFAHPRTSSWRPGASRMAVLALVGGPAAVVLAIRAAQASRRSASGAAATAEDGYAAAPSREQAAVNLLGSYLLTLAGARSLNYVIEQRRPVRPWSRKTPGRRVHHFVPGVVLVLVSGAAAVLVRDGRAGPWLALPFGSGMALTLDETALLFEMEDVYWRQERIAVLQGAVALGAAVSLGFRLLRRGERGGSPAGGSAR